MLKLKTDGTKWNSTTTNYNVESLISFFKLNYLRGGGVKSSTRDKEDVTGGNATAVYGKRE